MKILRWVHFPRWKKSLRDSCILDVILESRMRVSLLVHRPQAKEKSLIHYFLTMKLPTLNLHRLVLCQRVNGRIAFQWQQFQRPPKRTTWRSLSEWDQSMTGKRREAPKKKSNFASQSKKTKRLLLIVEWTKKLSRLITLRHQKHLNKFSLRQSQSLLPTHVSKATMAPFSLTAKPGQAKHSRSRAQQWSSMGRRRW